MVFFFRSCLLCLFFFLLTVKVSSAASVSLSAPTSSYTYIDEIPLHIKLTISSPDDTNYYLRGVFAKEGSSNYCGLTWNGTSFYSGPYSTSDGWKQFLKVTIKDGLWEGEMKVKIDSADSGCKESGNYAVKIERFTESGSGQFDPQEALSLTLALPTPTSEPTPTAKPTPTMRPLPTTKTVESVRSTPSSLSPAISLPQEGATISQKMNPHYVSYTSSDEAILGEATKSAAISMIPTSTVFPVKVLGSSTSLWPFILSTMGGGILILCAILAFRIYKRRTVL